MDKRDKNKFWNIIHNVDKYKLDKYGRNAIKTFLNFEKYIINVFDYELSNGIVEETNNMIKQLKHNACGYRLFSHFKSRIMFIKRLYNPLNNKVKENWFSQFSLSSFIISFWFHQHYLTLNQN